MIFVTKSVKHTWVYFFFSRMKVLASVTLYDSRYHSTQETAASWNFAYSDFGVPLLWKTLWTIFPAMPTFYEYTPEELQHHNIQCNLHIFSITNMIIDHMSHKGVESPRPLCIQHITSKITAVLSFIPATAATQIFPVNL